MRLECGGRWNCRSTACSSQLERPVSGGEQITMEMYLKAASPMSQEFVGLLVTAGQLCSSARIRS
jgi:hypothetical protein